MQKKVEDCFNNNCFSIPEYQRDYAWEAKNLEDLWEDLLEAKEAKNDEMGHYLGTIVVSKNPKNPSAYDIIDGQQRATTIFMLRYALNSKTEKPERNLNHFIDDNDRWRLQVIGDNQDFFEKVLNQARDGKLNTDLESEAKTSAHKNLYEVFESIWDHVSDLSPQEAKDYLAVLNQMVLMWLEEKDSGRAIRMFQTVNDRGMPLSILDKLKALLILYSNKYCEGKLDSVINERFGLIFKTINDIRNHKVSSSLAGGNFQKEVEAKIFNYHALGQKDIGDHKYGVDEAYKKLKDLLKNKIKDKVDSESLYQWLDAYSSDLLGFSQAFLAVIERTEKEIEAFKILYVLKINTLFYSSLVRLQMNGILDDECLRLFAQAEICFFGLGSDNKTSAYKLFEFTSDKETFKNKLIELCQRLKNKYFSNLQQALNYIALDCYEWNKYFHYLFLTYRCQDMDIGAFQKLLRNKTYNPEIEHIIPQNALENGSLEQYGFEDEKDFKKCKDTFGNLLALEERLNISSGDAGLAKKQEEYKNSSVSYNRKFACSRDFLSFDKDRIEQENEKFTLWAKEFFKDFL